MSGGAKVWEPQTPVATISNYSSVVPQVFTATSGQLVFNITAFAYTPGTKSIMVFVNGSIKVPEVDVIETDSNTFTLVSASTAGDTVLVVGFIGSVNAVVDPYYLGAKAAAPTVDNQGVILGTSHEGYHYWNTTSNDSWTWTGTVWQLTTSSVATSANLVSISDAGGYFTGTDVEAALQEIGLNYTLKADLVSTANNKGASLIGIEDVDGNFVGVELEAVLKEIREGSSVTVAGAAVSSLIASSLSFPADRAIEFEAHLLNVTFTPEMFIELNGDSTVTNYYAAESIDGGAATFSNTNNTGVTLGTGDYVHITGTILPNSTSGKTLITLVASMWDSSAAQMQIINASILYTVSGTITSVGLVTLAGVLSLDVGSTLRVKLK